MELLSTKEVAKKLGVTVTTVYNYVKNKKLTPVYDDWTVDETMLFYESDVERLLNQRPIGYTTSQVAKRLGVHQTTISKQIKEGKIPAEKIRYRGRMTYFVQEETLKKLEQKYLSDKEKSFFYHPKWGYYLFQSFVNEHTKEKARVIELNKDSGFLITDSGKKVAFEHVKEQGFIPLEYFPEKKFINKPGYVHFRFEIPASLHSSIYEVIELFYRSVGHKNMKVYVSDGFIDIHIKPFLLHKNEEYFVLLEEHLISGSVKQRHNGILLDSGMERITIYPTTAQKKKIKTLADKQNMTLNEFILKIVNDYIEKN